MGRPRLPPGMYFRLLLIGYFEEIDSEGGIGWCAADAFALRDYLGGLHHALFGFIERRPERSETCSLNTT